MSQGHLRSNAVINNILYFSEKKPTFLKQNVVRWVLLNLNLLKKPLKNFWGSLYSPFPANELGINDKINNVQNLFGRVSTL